MTHPHWKLLSVSTDELSKRLWTSFFGLLEVKFLHGRLQSLDAQRREGHNPDELVPAWSSSTQEAEAGAPEVLGQPWGILDLP